MEMINALFIAGISTDIGKTYCVEKLLSYDYQTNNHQLSAIKPLITGWPLHGSALNETDTGKILAAQEKVLTLEAIHDISPWRYTTPLAPDLAQEKEQQLYDYNDLLIFCQTAIKKAEYQKKTLLIEGVGGVMSPISKKYTVIDWIKALSIPVVLVGGTYLGSITHLLTAVYTLRAYGIDVLQIVLNESSPTQVTLEDTLHSVASHTSLPVVAIPRKKAQFDIALDEDFRFLHRRLMCHFSSQ